MFLNILYVYTITTTEGVSLKYFSRPVSFGPESFVKIDYKGKHVGAADGSVSGMAFSLIMGLAEINNSEIKLKRVCHRHGILGLDKVINYIIEEWLNDIKKHQLQNVLISVGPMQPVVQLRECSNKYFLSMLPIRLYHRSGADFTKNLHITLKISSDIKDMHQT